MSPQGKAEFDTLDEGGLRRDTCPSWDYQHLSTE